jgi:beta-xylosidase
MPHVVKRSVRILARLLVGAAIVVAACLTGSAVGSHAASPSATLHYQNPVFKKDFPDPMVLRLGQHNYYAYGTVTSWDLGYFPILHSTDLVHWKQVGDLFKVGHIPAWSTTDWWAPDVIKRGKTYYAFYTGNKNGTHCVAVATSSKPQGGFIHRAVIGCGDSTGHGYIDPDPFIDRDGKAYLYVSVDDPHHSISVIPLSKNLLHASGPRKELFTLSQAWEHGQNFSTVEGPFLIRRGAQYYLFYSGNDWNGNYSMGFAGSKSPLGPFNKCTCNPILTGDSRVHGPGGGSVVQGPDNNLWMVYHAWPGQEGYDRGGIRNMRIDPIVWKGDIPSVTVTPK